MSTVVSDSIRRAAEPPREPRVHREPQPATVRLTVELRVTPRVLSGPGQLCDSLARAILRAGARREFPGLEHIRGATVRDVETGVEVDSGE